MWDASSQTPWYRFQNPDWIQTWYDDSLSLSKKYDFVNAKNIGGIGIWALGYDDGYNELWGALRDKITIKSSPSIPANYFVESLGGGMVSVNFSNDENAIEYEVVEIISDSTQGRIVGKFLKSPILIQGLKDNKDYYQEAGDVDFHYRIMLGSKNTQLISVLFDGIYHLIRMYRVQLGMSGPRVSTAFDEHQQIVKAIANRDPELAEILMRRHIAVTQQSLSKKLSNETKAI